MTETQAIMRAIKQAQRVAKDNASKGQHKAAREREKRVTELWERLEALERQAAA